MVQIDIELPIYCYDCPCHNGENGRCNITGDSTSDKRPFDCPLKEDKSKKDDLISRRVVLRDLGERMVSAKNAPPEYSDAIRHYISGLHSAINTVIEAPSVQPEHKKGKWIITDMENNRIWHCNCSECGEDPQHFISGTEDWWINKLPNFCLNCGADMRGERKITND